MVSRYHDPRSRRKLSSPVEVDRSGEGIVPEERPRRRGRVVREEVRQEVLREVASGRLATEVAREYGIHSTTITKWKRRTGDRKGLGQAPHRAQEQGEPAAAPRETGRYQMAFKEEVLGQVACGRKVVEVAKQYDLPETTIHRWKKAQMASGGEIPEPKSTRPQTGGASPINEEHRSLVLSLKEKHPNMGPAQLQNQLKRFWAVKLSRHMIARIFNEAGIRLEKRARPESDPAKNRFEMSRPNELWAVDFKEIWIHSQKAHVLFVLDDFSRFCLGFALTQKPTAELAIGTVECAIARYGRPERILSDRGPQFHAWNGVSRFDEFLADFFIDHSLIKAGHAFTNGKIEAFNRSLESELLDVEEFSSLGEAEEGIRRFVSIYNFFRTHMGIDGLVPADRYFGMIEEARRALQEGLKKPGPCARWLQGLVSEDGVARRQPTVLQLVLTEGRPELVVLGRRFSLS